MRKLKLDVDSLEVESFVAHPHAPQGGTVHGQVGDWQTLVEDDSTGCDGGGWGSLFGTCAGCPTVGTCVGPTYCCPPTWRPTCNPSCNMSCRRDMCGL
jgi:hypothetical protein